LLLHGHLDVVPADAAAWTHGPFDGDIADGMLWGRGAVDMKNFVAMIVSAVRRLVEDGFTPQRDVVLAFWADEESGMSRGSGWMVDNHSEVFRGVRTALGEGGGYSVSIGGSRAYLMNTGEKGTLHLRATARGAAGHASLPAVNNPIPRLAAAVARIDAIDWPVEIGQTTAVLVERLRQMTGADDDVDIDLLAEAVGPSAPRIRAGWKNVSNVTMVQGGYKENVVPESASIVIDCRFLPGRRDWTVARLAEAVGPDIELEVELDLPAFESAFEGELVEIIQEVLGQFDEGAVVLPHLIPGGTDAKQLRRIGITGYGFIPLRLPADFAFPAMFHGVDERVPLDALVFGESVLTEILRRH
jgi:acetylornithine deacetylase/succinyl-diaminopimelate desuccinylase-like protein